MSFEFPCFISEEVLFEVKNATLKIVQKHLRDYLMIARKSGVNQLIVTTKEKVNDYCIISGVEVMKVYLPALFKALGDFQKFSEAFKMLERRSYRLYISLLKRITNFRRVRNYSKC